MGEVLFSIKGVNGQLSVYDDKVIITRKGMLGLLTQGLSGEKTIPISTITSVQYKEGGALFNGFIQFAVLGGREKQGGVFAATEDENTVMLRAGEQSEIGKKVKEYVEGRILELSKPQASTVVQQVSAADELLKFKGLLDAGVITQAEFDDKKKQLLGL